MQANDHSELRTNLIGRHEYDDDDDDFMDVEQRRSTMLSRRSIDDELKVTVECKNLTYFVGKKKILNQVNLKFVPGTLAAVLGPSGAGKTTLVNIILGNAGGKIEGDVLINGIPGKAPPPMFKSVAKLIPQEDILIAPFTVRETLYYQSELVLPSTLSREEKDKRVDHIIDILNLRDCIDVKIGDPDSRGVSGGQRKRVSIANDLLSNPAVLFVDEPTSGLDSKTAEDVVSILRDLAVGSRSGIRRTIITTIHQPSYRIFKLFDRVSLLVKGSVAFEGTVAQAEEYFTSINMPTPLNENPADHYLRCLQDVDVDVIINAWKKQRRALEQPDIELSEDGSGTESSGSSSAVDVVTGGNKSLWAKLCSFCSREENTTVSVDDELDASVLTSMMKQQQQLYDAERYPTSKSKQFWVIFKRTTYDNVKDPQKFVRGMFLKMAVGILIGTVWWRAGAAPREIQDVFPLSGSLFVMCLNSIVDTLATTLILFPTTRSLMRREYKNGTYALLPFYCGLMLSKILITIFYVCLMTFPIYFMVGLQCTPEKVFYFISILVLLTSIGNALGVIVGATSKDLVDAQNKLMPTLAPLILFSGYVLPYRELVEKPFFKFFYDISFVQYGLSALQLNQYTGLELEFEVIGIDFPVDGAWVLKEMGLDPATHHIQNYLLILLGYTIGITSLGYFIIRHNLHKKTN